jgi:GNAT superfamily N-acetyltransferase
MIIFRKLLHEDYKDILEISKDIWEGLDYLPELFHNWVDADGCFLGAVDTDINKVVAVAKLSVLHDGSGWLEGLRVHSAYRGQKLSRKLTEILLRQATEALAAGRINKIAFSTHLSNVESRTLMEKLDFFVKEAQLLVLKHTNVLPKEIKIENFIVEPWDVSFNDFKDHLYLKRRDNLFPLAFVFQETTENLYRELKSHNSFVKINGHYGVFKYKGEPNFLAFEDTFEAIDTFMNYYLLLYRDKGIAEIYTPVLPQDKTLIQKLISEGYYSWSDCSPDYLYYVHKDCM